MQGGEGGARRAVVIVVGFCLIGIVLLAVIDRQRVNRLSPAAAESTTAVVDNGEPCGGAGAIPDAVTSSATGGLDDSSDQYDVSDFRVAVNDTTWGRFSVVPKAGEDSFQNQYGVVRCVDGQWAVTDLGTSAVGCSGVNTVPAHIRFVLGLACPT